MFHIPSPTKAFFAFRHGLGNTTPVQQPNGAEQQHPAGYPHHSEEQSLNGKTTYTRLPEAPANHDPATQYNTELRHQIEQLRVEGARKNKIEDNIYHTIDKVWRLAEQQFAVVSTDQSPEQHAFHLIGDDKLAEAAFKCTVDRLERELVDDYDYKERKNLDTLGRGLCDDKRHLLAVLFGPKLLFVPTNRSNLYRLYRRLLAEEKVDPSITDEHQNPNRLARILAELNHSRNDRLKTLGYPFYTSKDVSDATNRIATRIADVKQLAADTTHATQAQRAPAPNYLTTEDNHRVGSSADEDISSDDDDDNAIDIEDDPNGQMPDGHSHSTGEADTEIETIEKNTESNNGPYRLGMSATSNQTATISIATEQFKKPTTRNPLTPDPSEKGLDPEHTQEEASESDQNHTPRDRAGSRHTAPYEPHRSPVQNAESIIGQTPPPSATDNAQVERPPTGDEQTQSASRTPLPTEPRHPAPTVDSTRQIRGRMQQPQDGLTTNGQGDTGTKTMPPPDSETNQHAHVRMPRQQPKPSVTQHPPTPPTNQRHLKRKTVGVDQGDPEPNSKRQRTAVKHAQARSPTKTQTVPPKYALRLFRYTRSQTHQAGAANSQQTAGSVTANPRAAKTATPTPDPADVYLAACRDLQDRVKEIPEVQSLLAEYDSVASTTRWSGTMHEEHAKLGRNIIDKGTIPKMWTIGSPGGPIFPDMEQVHGLTDHKYDDADCLLLTRNQHQSMLAAGWGCDKVILLRDPVGTQPSGPDHSLAKKLNWFNSVADIWGPNNTTASTRRLDVKTAAGDKHRPMTMREVVKTLSTAEPLKERPPCNFLDLQGTPGGTPPGLLRYADLLRDVCLAASTLEERLIEDGKTRFYGLVGNPLTNAGTGALQHFEIIGERGTVSAPHMDMYGATTYCTLEKRTEGWMPTESSPFDSLKLWPLLPTHAMKREDALKVYDSMERHGVDLIDNLPPGPNGTSCKVPLILLLTGDTIIMPPGTIHFPISITTAYMTGGMVWHKDMLAQTLDFWAYCASKLSAHTTNQDTKWTHLTIATAVKHFISTGTFIDSLLPHHPDGKAACEKWVEKVYHQITHQGLTDKAIRELPTSRQLQLRKIVTRTTSSGESLPVNSRTRK